ncbi:MAG: YeeE/YedE family protein [Pseudomonadota bacterium]
MDLNIHTETLAAVLGLSIALGALTSRTNFCTMGAVSDWINIGDLGRMRSWMLAIATAMAGLVGMESAGVIDLSTTYPPYRSPQLAWLRYLTGGLLFGVGMTLASGCGNKTLVRIGGGNLKSVFVLAVGALFAYLMIFTDFYALAFGWMGSFTLSLDARGIDSQALGSVVAGTVGGDAATLNRALAWLIAGALAVWAFANAEFRRDRDNIAGGIGFGLAVLAGWWLTAGPRAAAWKEWAEFADVLPSRVEAQSYTFVGPMADSARYLLDPTNTALLNFGVMALVGVIVGAFLYAIVAGKFRIEWFRSSADLVRHGIGGALMGIGGVLASGCSVGQGITGVSTLSLGSAIALLAIIIGSALTMKASMWWLMRE